MFASGDPYPQLSTSPFTGKTIMKTLIHIGLFLVLLFGASVFAAEPLVVRTVLVEDEAQNPFEAGRRAAEKLRSAMDGVEPKLVLLADSFEGRENKEKMLKGVCSSLPKEKIFGLSTYGMFVRDKAEDGDNLALIGIGGEKFQVESVLQTELGVAKLKMEDAEKEIRSKLDVAGRAMVEKCQRHPDHRLCIVLADAHSPKNGFLVQGMQRILGKDAPILGGSANKNPGQNFVYHQGEICQDAAILLTLSGPFQVALGGKFANQGETIVKTATEAASTAVSHAKGAPLGMIAFSCAGRKSKLEGLDDELKAIQSKFYDGPIFGCFCAGEIGPADATVETQDIRYCGSGWYLMLAVLYCTND